MWVDQGQQNKHEVLIKQLEKCIKLLAKYAEKPDDDFSMPFINEVRADIVNLITDLKEQEVSAKTLIKQLTKICQNTVNHYRGRPKPRIYVSLCTKLFIALSTIKTGVVA